jgi:hypothetical protein
LVAYICIVSTTCGLNIYICIFLRKRIFKPNNPSKITSVSGKRRCSFESIIFKPSLSSSLLEIISRRCRGDVISLLVFGVGAPYIIGNGFKSRIVIKVTKRWQDKDEDNNKGKDDWVMFTHYHNAWA